MSIKVVLFEDEDLVRGGIRLILESDPDIEVVAEAGDGTAAVDLVARHQPDIVLTDIQMPGVGGLDVVKAVAECVPAPAVIILTTFDLDEYVHTALRDGAAGFLLKDTPPRELIHAMHVVAGGEAMLSPRITSKLLSTFSATTPNREATTRVDALTPREREVAVAVAEGLSNAAIAQHLYMSESTVKVHIGRLMTKLDAANRTQVAIRVHDAGLV